MGALVTGVGINLKNKYILPFSYLKIQAIYQG